MTDTCTYRGMILHLERVFSNGAQWWTHRESGRSYLKHRGRWSRVYVTCK